MKIVVLAITLTAVPLGTYAAQLHTDPIANADYAWAFAGPGASAGTHQLEPIGDCRLGVSTGEKMGKCATFSGGHLTVSDTHVMPIGVNDNFSLALRFYLDSEYFDLSTPADAVLFEWIGHDKAEEAKRHFISFEVLSIGFIRDNRYLGFWIDNCFVNASLKKLRADRWHDAVLRVKDKEAEFFLDGRLVAKKHIERDVIAQQNYKNVDVVARDYCLFGTNHRQDRPYHGKIGRFGIWNTCLADEQVAALSDLPNLDTTLEKPADWQTNWSGFYEEDISLEDAYARMYADYVHFYRRALKEDVYFPRYHLTTPGFMTEPSMSSLKKDAYHIFPHGHINWVDLTYQGGHYWHHFTSQNLLQWKLMRFPEWPHPISGNIIERDGAAVCFPQNVWRQFACEKWISTDHNLEQWRFDKQIDLPPPDSGVFPVDHFIFNHQNRRYMLGAYAGMDRRHPETGGLVELYRATDDTFDTWEYVGEFYRGSASRGVHHPRCFSIADKLVMDSDLPIDSDVEYVLGRIENDKFVREGGGRYQFGYAGWRWGQTITEPSGRVLRWCLFAHLINENNLINDMVRRGWEHAYSLPRVVELKDDWLSFTPAVELSGLRKKHLYKARGQSLQKNRNFLPHLTGDAAQVEVRCTGKVRGNGKLGIVLKASDDDLVRFYYDRRASEIVLQFDKSRHGGLHPGMHANARAPLDLAPGEHLELRLFFDHSIIEVYANGLCSSGRWFPDAPSEIEVGFFAEDDPITIDELDIWELDTIWQEYAEQ